MRLHAVNPFGSAYGGSEQGILQLQRALSGRCEVLLWSESDPDPALRQVSIRRIDPARGEFPSGGTLLIHGNYFAPGAWLESARFERVILGYNTVVRVDLKHVMIDRLRRIGPFEIVYASHLLQAWVGVPGTVLYSQIDLGCFRPQLDSPSRPFTIGRLSRDVPEKHDPDDVAVYRHFAARGARVRIMGGTCLSNVLGDVPGIELIAAGQEPPEIFLASLDCFYYRPGPKWTEAGGRVVAEAMACGLPVVADDRHGYAEWIEQGVGGFLFRGTEQAVELLQRLQADAALRRRIGAVARARMEEVFSESSARAYVEFFSRSPAGVGAGRPDRP